MSTMTQDATHGVILECPGFIRELGVEASFDMHAKKLIKGFYEKYGVDGPEESLPLHVYDPAADIRSVYPNTEEEKAHGTFSNRLFGMVLNSVMPPPATAMHMDEPFTEADFAKFGARMPEPGDGLPGYVALFRHYDDAMTRARIKLEDIRGGTAEDAARFNGMVLHLGRKSRWFAGSRLASGAAAIAFLNMVGSRVLAATDVIRRSTDTAELRAYLGTGMIGGGSGNYEYTSGTVSPSVGRNWNRSIYHDGISVQVLYHKDRIAGYMAPVRYDLLNPGGAGFDVRRDDPATLSNPMWGIYAREMEIRIADCPLRDGDGRNMIKEIRIYEDDDWATDDENYDLAKECESIADSVDIVTTDEDEENEEMALDDRISAAR